MSRVKHLYDMYYAAYIVYGESIHGESIYIYSIWRTCCKISSLTHNYFLQLEPALQIVYMYVQFNKKAC